MNTTSFINFVQNLVNAGSLICIGVVAILIIAGLIRPTIFKRVMRSFTDRKYIAGLGIFVCLFCATVFVATDSPVRDLQQQQDKIAPSAAENYEQQPGTGPAEKEEAQTAPAGQSTPQSSSVQGAQTMPEMEQSTGMEAAPIENSEYTRSQTAQAQSPKSECKIRLLKVVCL